MTDMMEWLEQDTFQPLNDLIQSIIDVPEDALTDEVVQSMIGMVRGAFTDSIKKESAMELKRNFEDQGFSRAGAQKVVDETKLQFYRYVESLHVSAKKNQLIQAAFNVIYEIYELALAEYHQYSIQLPIKLGEGATMPTYAHDSDAAADLYAAADITLPAHSLSNLVPTEVQIALPEGWMAMIFPRSSIGMHTGLRLSNCVGIIDSKVKIYA